MDIEIDSTIKLTTECFISDNEIKTHDCEIGDWWGEEICKNVNFQNEISKIKPINGNYIVEIKLIKINK